MHPILTLQKMWFGTMEHVHHRNQHHTLAKQMQTIAIWETSIRQSVRCESSAWCDFDAKITILCGVCDAIFIILRTATHICSHADVRMQATLSNFEVNKSSSMSSFFHVFFFVSVFAICVALFFVLCRCFAMHFFHRIRWVLVCRMRSVRRTSTSRRA